LFLTYPLFPVYKIQKDGNRTYFLSDHCLYYLEGSAFKPLLSEPTEFSKTYLDMLVDGDKVYGLWVKTGGSNIPFFGKENLTIFDLNSGKQETYLLPITYADHLAKKDNDLFGYGIFRIFDDSGEGEDKSVVAGGLFRFSLTNKTISKMTDLPTVGLSFDPLRAKSLVFTGNESVQVNYLRYVSDKDTFVTGSSQEVSASGYKHAQVSKLADKVALHQNFMNFGDYVQEVENQMSRDRQPIDLSEWAKTPVIYLTIPLKYETVK